MNNLNVVPKKGAEFGILQSSADWRSLVWSLVLFPVPLGVAFLKPDLTLWMLPFALYLAFCAGVLTHYHNHTGVFRGRLLNRIYSVWLSIFYGFPIFSWIPTHNLNHHRYTNGPRDATSTFRSGRPDGLLELLYYPIRSSAWQLPNVVGFLRTARAKRPADYRWALAQIVGLVVANIAILGALVALHGPRVGGAAYGLVMFVPAMFAPYSMMFINYLQHVGCDPKSADNHSRNFVGRWENWLVFEAGLHTVHHEHPTTHWSEYPALHAQREAFLEPVLQQRNVFSFLLHRYVLGESRHILVARIDGLGQPASVEGQTAHA
jgi:beta-carotene hydroxylase